MKIGLKSIITIFLIFITSIVFGYLLSSRPHFFLDMEPRVGFTIGVFAVTVTYFFIRFWNINDSSSYTLCIVRGADDNPDRIPIFNGDRLSASLLRQEESSFEIPSFLVKTSYFLIFLLLGVILIDNRSLFLADAFPETLDRKKDFCPTEVETFKKPKPKPGCELVLKAYEMGYADKLGDCDPRLKDGKIEEPKVCEKRRHDEPYVHYAFRLLERFWEKNGEDDFFDSLHRKYLTFREKITKSELLFFEQTKSLRGLPRASHHVFTNLAHPAGVVRGAFSWIIPKESCQERISNAPAKYMGDPKNYAAESKLLGHSFDQMLFNQRHEPGAGYCPEYVIHWNVDANTCTQLAENADSLLAELGIDEQIKAVLSRIEANIGLAQLESTIEQIHVENSMSEPHGLPPAKELLGKNSPTTPSDTNTTQSNKEQTADTALENTTKQNSENAFPEQTPAPPKPPQNGSNLAQNLSENKNVPSPLKSALAMKKLLPKYISFQCLIEDETATKAESKNIKVNYASTEFNVSELRVPRIDTKLLTGGKALRTDYIEHLSGLMAPGFSNVGFESQANILDTDIIEMAQNAYKDNSLILTKLELLKHVDILQGNDWIKNSGNILDIYPWQLHLGNYVKRFRDAYKEKRGRL